MLAQESVLAKEPPDRREPPCAIVDLDDDLPDERPVLGGDAAQHLQFLAFDIDFEQINARKRVLLDVGRCSPLISVPGGLTMGVCALRFLGGALTRPTLVISSPPCTY